MNEKLVNLATCPIKQDPSYESPMMSILPFYPNSKKIDLLPTCFDTQQQGGLVFWGEEKCIVECVSLVVRSARYGSFAAPARFVSFAL